MASSFCVAMPIYIGTAEIDVLIAALQALDVR